MTALLEEAVARARRLPDAEQDAVAMALLKTLEQFPAGGNDGMPRPYRRAGSAQGMFQIPNNFDEPLEDFQQRG